jgi:DNA-binding MarR family transcriptional regulator
MIAKPEWMGPATIYAPLQATRCLKSRERVLYAYLVATDAAMKGDAFPNITTIADHLGWCTRTVNRGLARLFEQGFIVTTQSRNDGKFAHNHYHIADPQKSTVRQFGRANTAVRCRSAVSTGAVQVPIAERKPMAQVKREIPAEKEAEFILVDGKRYPAGGWVALGARASREPPKRKSGYLRAAGLAA